MRQTGLAHRPLRDAGMSAKRKASKQRWRARNPPSVESAKRPDGRPDGWPDGRPDGWPSRDAQTTACGPPTAPRNAAAGRRGRGSAEKRCVASAAAIARASSVRARGTRQARVGDEIGVAGSGFMYRHRCAAEMSARREARGRRWVWDRGHLGQTDPEGPAEVLAEVPVEVLAEPRSKVSAGAIRCCMSTARISVMHFK